MRTVTLGFSHGSLALASVADDRLIRELQHALPTMMDVSSLAGALYGQLNTHGYGLQYRVIRELNEIFAQQEHPWKVTVAEFPTGGSECTRLDIVIQASGTRLYMLAECKRANPRLKHWCFVRAPFVRGDGSTEQLNVEHVMAHYELGSNGRANTLHSFGHKLHGFSVASDFYHIGLEIKDPTEKGDSSGGKKEAIEGAAGQVCKGLNGFVRSIGKLTKPPDVQTPAQVSTILIPAIITTATLWTTDVDLSAADLGTGELPKEVHQNPEQRPWLYLQYPVSPSLKHDLDSRRSFAELPDMLDGLYMRTIVVINSSRLADFFMTFDARGIYHHAEQRTSDAIAPRRR